MPTSEYFDQVAPWPSDVPTADIPTVSLRRLETGDPQEGNKLFQACREYGFFLLDLHDSTRGTPLLEDAAKMFKLTVETLDLDRQVLDQFAYKPPVDLLGYKAPGLHKTDDGFDDTEQYSIGQDDLLGSQTRENPQPIEEHRTECRVFIQRAYNTLAVIMAALDVQLDLPKGTLASLSALSKESTTSLRLLRTRPQKPSATFKKTTVGAHTDVGLITLLFNVVGGLQILPADKEDVSENWCYVRPRPGCTVINIGDTLVEWTGGLLRSSLHRVVTAPGDQYRTTRISLAYLIRPAREGTMRRLRGGSKIIPPVVGEEDTRTVEEWAAERADQSIKGILRPRTHGGVAIASH